jgi:GTPase
VRQNSQIVVFDTPGLVSPNEMKKHHLNTAFVSSSRHSIQNADLIGVVHDVSNAWTRNTLSPVILNLLETYPKIPSFLILNKIDLLKSKRVLLDAIKILTEDSVGQKGKKVKDKTAVADKNPATDTAKVGWPHFEDVFMVSAITGDGLNKVMDFVLSHSRTGQWEFPSDQYTDRTPEEIIVQSVQARLLDYLPQEIPYLLSSEIEYYSNEGGIVYASVIVKCPNSRLERLMCGVSNGKLKQINERVTSDLVETFKAPVHLTITSAVPKKAD